MTEESHTGITRWSMAVGWIGLGIVAGVVVVLLGAGPSSTGTATTVEVPAPPGQELTVRVDGGSSGPVPPAVLGGIAGGLIGVVGAVSAQWVSGRIKRGQRTDDRREKRLDALAEAVTELDKAYAADMGVGVPSSETVETLLATDRKFTRTVTLVDEPAIRKLAQDCHEAMRSYALTRSEPDEEGSTAGEVLEAQAALFAKIREAILRMR